MVASKRTNNSSPRSSRSVALTKPPRTLTAQLAEITENLRATVATLPCIAFTLWRDKTGAAGFIGLTGDTQKLLRVKAEDMQASFTTFLETLDPAEQQRFEENLAMAATKRGALVWTGKLRTRGRQKARWMRIQAQKPRVAAGVTIWHGTLADISRERDLEISLKRSREQLSELSSYLEAGKEEERERIARDIHDELGSLLVAIKIEASLLTSKLPRNLSALRDKAHSIENLLDQAMGTASRVARELRPGILKEFGLAAAIECQAEDFSQRTGITCRAQCNDEGLDIEEHCALAVFRIVQEALTNVAKHAHASLVALRLYRDRQQLIVEIRDNGWGINESDLHKPKSFGLRGIRERIRSLRGELRIGAGEQGGTHIVLSLPLKSANRRAAAETDVQRELF